MVSDCRGCGLRHEVEELGEENGCLVGENRRLGEGVQALRLEVSGLKTSEKNGGNSGDIPSKTYLTFLKGINTMDKRHVEGNTAEAGKSAEAALADVLQVIRSMEEFGAVEFVIFYGSRAQRTQTEASDLDICVYYKGKEEEMSRFRLKLLSRLPSYCDVQIFQQLPLYVRKEVLRGRVIYARDRRFLHDVALKTIRDFESFRPRFYDYIYR